MKTDWFEIFEAGDYGTKGSYTTGDLDDVVEQFDTGEHIPPVIIGHHSDESIRENELTDGKVSALKRDGNKLLAQADITNPDHAEAWNSDRLLTWSVGLYSDFKDRGKKALRHLAALGKTPPEIKGLNYKPAFTFAADEDAGDFVEIKTFEEENNDMDKLEKANERIAELEKENAIAKAEAGKVAEFSEEREKLTSDLDTVNKELKTAEAKIKTMKADSEKVKRDAEFAEIETQVEEAHKAGLPKTHGDHLRTVLAIERGLPITDGAVEFAEGKSGKPSEAMKALREVKYVPTDKESADAIKSGDIEVGDAEFSELKDEDKVAKLEELQRADFAEHKTDETYTMEMALSAVLEKHPGLE